MSDSSTPAREIPNGDLIQLPRFDASGAVSLGADLLRAAEAQPDLPSPIQRARVELDAQLAALRAAIEARLAAATSADPARVAAVANADCNLDACWSALFDWLTGFSKLPGVARETAEAVELLRELYPDGLSFISLPYELEWRESEGRVRRIASETLGERIQKLGGRPFLDALRKAHKEYGDLLGLPRAAGAQKNDDARLREALDAFTAALREYALRVTAHVEMDAPDTAKLARALLTPLMSYRGARVEKR
jgi:hypothetical protein